MDTSQYSRFSLAKDLGEWLEQNPVPPWGALEGSDEKNWKYSYTGDRDFLSYMNLYEKDIEVFEKYFPDMDIYLKNIFWDPLFSHAEIIIKNILKKGKGSTKEKSTLALIHLFPLEMAIVGEAMKELGYENIVYDFNRVPAVNSLTKTLEAGLFLVGWKSLPLLSSRMKNLVSKFERKTEKYTRKYYYIFTESDSVPNWNITHVDPYVKTAIHFKEQVIIYRLESLPDEKFLLGKDIDTIIFFDTDKTHSIDDYYMTLLDTAIFSIEICTIDTLIATSEIGYYENYVVEKNREYMKYRKEILGKNESIVTGGGMKKKVKYHSVGTDRPEVSKKEVSYYLGSLSFLFLVFMIVEYRGGQPVFSSLAGPSRGSWSSSTWRPSSGGSWGSFSSSSKASTSSTISSFGGGGFSKGGGSGG